MVKFCLFLSSLFVFWKGVGVAFDVLSEDTEASFPGAHSKTCLHLNGIAHPSLAWYLWPRSMIVNTGLGLSHMCHPSTHSPRVMQGGKGAEWEGGSSIVKGWGCWEDNPRGISWSWTYCVLLGLQQQKPGTPLDCRMTFASRWSKSVLPCYISPRFINNQYYRTNSKGTCFQCLSYY